MISSIVVYYPGCPKGILTITRTNRTALMIKTQKNIHLSIRKKYHQSEIIAKCEYEGLCNHKNDYFIKELLMYCSEKNASEDTATPAPIYQCIVIIMRLASRLVLKGENQCTLSLFEPWPLSHRRPPMLSAPTVLNWPDVGHNSFVIKVLQLYGVNAEVLYLHDDDAGGNHIGVGVGNKRLQGKESAKSKHNHNGYIRRSINHSHSLGNGGNCDDDDPDFCKGTNYSYMCVLEYRQTQIMINITSVKSQTAYSYYLPQQKVCVSARHELRRGGSESIKRTASVPVAAEKSQAKTTATVSSTAFNASRALTTTTAAERKSMSSAEKLTQNTILDAAVTSSIRSERTTALSTPITVLRKLIALTKKATITTTKSTATYGFIRHVCLLAALLLSALTVNHVNGQHLGSRGATKTSTIQPFRNTTETTIPVSVISTLEIGESAILKDRRTNSSERSIKNLLPQNQLQQLDQKRTIVDMQVDLGVSQWRALVDNFTSVYDIKKYQPTSNKVKSADITVINQRDGDIYRQETTQHNTKRFLQSPFIAASYSMSRSHERNITLDQHLSQITVEAPKIENAYKRDNSPIHYSQFNYDKSYISDLFNQQPKRGWPQRTPTITAHTTALSVAVHISRSVVPGRQRRRIRRSAEDFTDTHLRNSGGTELNTTTNNNEQHYSRVRGHMLKIRKRQQHNAKMRSQIFYGDEDTVRDAYSEGYVVKSLDVLENPTLVKSHGASLRNSMKIIDSFITDSINKNTHSQFAASEVNKKLLKLVMDSLHLQRLPDMKKVNVSQREYVTKYREYLLRVHERKRRELAELAYTIEDPVEWQMENAPLHIVSIAPNATEFEQYWRRKRNILNDSDEDEYDADAATDQETFTDNFVLPRMQRNKDGKWRRRLKGKTTMVLRFALEKNAAQLEPGDVEEANIRLMLIHSSELAVKSTKPSKQSRYRACRTNITKSGKPQASTDTPTKQKHILNLRVYQRLGKGKRLWLDGHKMDIEVDSRRADDTHSQWMQFDVTKAVEAWLREPKSNLGLEVQCDICQRVGARILNDMTSSTNVDDANADDAKLMPVLNIIGRMGVTYKEMRSNKHSNSAEATLYHHHKVATLSNGRHLSNAALDKHTCHKGNKRCCRHTMEVVFKEIKGFEFIIQPKVFDAGYCHGRCPPRYNPAHHHAMLQSLIWKQNRERAPRPCCAPSKLVELEVLHLDEKNSEKLKISTWTDMRVVECACS
ncbi:uncharacterized protein LOC118745552 isoform X2 [Rhagoletis pomonella]|uniref:uncharacterized protein LOC118745552 isoform X2 n=1 Tax=Rhagoletis pomonella TaxID=28610 RepID=UPI00178517EE|nr:uncharacterized protein LOC118745552 isoform X2 [Rhagoletis pomonella]